LQSAQVDFVFNPETIPGQDNRHNAYNGSSFPLADYPAALYELSMPIPHPDNGTSQLSTTNEQGAKVAVGVARPQTTLVDWVLILELDHADAFAPTAQLRNILLACVFGTAGVIALLVIPVAHLSVLPIQRLKEATKVSVQTPGDTSVCVAGSERLNEPRDANGDIGNVHDSSQRQQSKQDKKFLARMRHLWHSGRSQSKSKADPVTGPRTFKLPGKVEEKKHFITDELTELTSTFNELSDELTRHYTKLEERVAARTQELETSKKAAEAANESKTLFIASISHELKTPLNGILGMCAVCMSEDSISSVKASLQVIYKSGDLLLHLLNDLLTFSKNQIGQSLALEESEFALSDIKSQIVSLFDKQVRESHVNFGFKFVGTDSTQPGLEMSSEGPSGKKLSASGPPGTGRLKDMRLWGDMHRILQVIINLVSNSLKFAAESGKVEVRIKCIGDPAILSENSSRKEDSRRLSTTRHSTSSASKISNESRAQTSSATTSRLRGTSAGLYDPGRSLTPPPANARTLVFEFEVEDNGPGIPPHLQQSIFEPFVQGDVGLTKKYGGTGLGLSICSQLASLLGGAITLKSIVGIGTTFNMRIPLKLVDTRASSQSSNISRPSHLSMHSGDNPHTRPSRSGTPVGFENDPKPRLVGLSLPFFAPTLPLQSEARSNQYEAVDRIEISTIKNTTGKLQVLVAEDNLVNQEVVLR
jgi:osomolarity two-component system, sensor histidine kinase SLN1